MQRHHLMSELAKFGSQPDKEVVDRLVQRHYPSLLKHKEEAAQMPSSSVQPAVLPAVSSPRAAVASASIVDRPATPPLSADWRLDESSDSFAESSLLDLDFATDEPVPMDGLNDIPSFALETETPEIGALCKPSSSSAFIGDRNEQRMADEDRDASLSIDPHLIEAPPSLASTAPAMKSEEHGFYDMSYGDFSPKAEPVDDVDFNAESTTRPKLATQSKFTAFSPPRLGSTHDDSPEPADDELDGLRPPLEEYKKLSSKEKRQLRNKISARNFRTRRKEYITLLEEQVTDRDSLIDKLRQQVSSLSLQNGQLKDEVRTLQNRSLGSVDVAKFIGALQRNTNQQSTDTPLDVSQSSTPQLSRQPSSSNALPHSPRLPALQPNTRKDVANNNPTVSNSPAFWGGVSSMSSAPTLVA